MDVSLALALGSSSELYLLFGAVCRAYCLSCNFTRSALFTLEKQTTNVAMPCNGTVYGQCMSVVISWSNKDYNVSGMTIQLLFQNQVTHIYIYITIYVGDIKALSCGTLLIYRSKL